MEHRRIRQVIHVVCDGFYTQIKDETEWEKINAIAQEWYERYKTVPLAVDFIRAFVAEWCRTHHIEKEGEADEGQPDNNV